MPRVTWNFSEFFSFNIQAVAVTFLKVIDQFALYVLKLTRLPNPTVVWTNESTLNLSCVIT